MLAKLNRIRHITPFEWGAKASDSIAASGTTVYYYSVVDKPCSYSTRIGGWFWLLPTLPAPFLYRDSGGSPVCPFRACFPCGFPFLYK